MSSSDMIEVSCEELRALRIKLLMAYKAVILDCQRLEAAVEKLEETFEDDGIDEIKAVCEGIYKELGENKDALLLISEALEQAAALIEESKEVVGQ
ncbi:MAG: hypothetical protein IIY11_00990 [Clostridia bacterium]|nr:hypothetical protein [Clostridia bacterium]MBQ2327194.1 hypothetical protein [Clostridia bacterium]